MGLSDGMMLGSGRYGAEILQQQRGPVQRQKGRQPEAFGIDGGVDVFLCTSPVTYIYIYIHRGEQRTLSSLRCDAKKATFLLNPAGFAPEAAEVSKGGGRGWSTCCHGWRGPEM